MVTLAIVDTDGSACEWRVLQSNTIFCGYVKVYDFATR